MIPIKPHFQSYLIEVDFSASRLVNIRVVIEGWILVVEHNHSVAVDEQRGGVDGVLH